MQTATDYRQAVVTGGLRRYWHRQHYTRGGDGADWRDRPAPSHRSNARAHRRAVFVRERLDGRYRGHHWGRRGNSHRGGRLRLPGLDPSAGRRSTPSRTTCRRRDRVAVGHVSGVACQARRSFPSSSAAPLDRRHPPRGDRDQPALPYDESDFACGNDTDSA